MFDQVKYVQEACKHAAQMQKLQRSNKVELERLHSELESAHEECLQLKQQLEEQSKEANKALQQKEKQLIDLHQEREHHHTQKLFEEKTEEEVKEFRHRSVNDVQTQLPQQSKPVEDQKNDQQFQVERHTGASLGGSLRDLQDSCHEQQASQLELKLQTPDVYKQRQFTYTGNRDHLVWEEYGVRLQFFQSTSKVYIEGAISVVSVDDDNYKLPEGSGLISAVYDIVVSKPFPVPVTVEIQHCIPLQDENEASRLGMSFVFANTKQGPPYIFHELKEGNFSPGSSYGEIQLTHFCRIAQIIKWRLGHPIPFFAGLFFSQKDEANFVVTQNLAAHISAVNEFYKSALKKQRFCVKCNRNVSAIKLKMPTNSSWKVTPLVLPAMIDMDVVLQYQPGRAIPQATLVIEWVGKGKQTQHYVTVKLIGVHSPKSFLLQCPPNIMNGEGVTNLQTTQTNTSPTSSANGDTSTQHTPHSTQPDFMQFGKPTLSSLMNLVGCEVKSKWRQIGSGLGVAEADLKSIKKEESGSDDGIQSCMRCVFSKWQTAMTSPCTWQNLANVLVSPAVNEKAAMLKLHKSLCENKET